MERNELTKEIFRSIFKLFDTHENKIILYCQDTNSNQVACELNGKTNFTHDELHLFEKIKNLMGKNPSNKLNQLKQMYEIYKKDKSGIIKISYPNREKFSMSISEILGDTYQSSGKSFKTKSSFKSPVKSSHKSPIKSPNKSPIKSPIKSPMKSIKNQLSSVNKILSTDALKNINRQLTKQQSPQQEQQDISVYLDNKFQNMNNILINRIDSTMKTNNNDIVNILNNIIQNETTIITSLNELNNLINSKQNNEQIEQDVDSMTSPVLQT